MVLVHRLDAPDFAVECSASLFRTADSVDHFSIELRYSVFAAADCFVECYDRPDCESYACNNSDERKCSHRSAHKTDTRGSPLCRCSQSSEDFNSLADCSIDLSAGCDQISCSRQHGAGSCRKGSHLDDLFLLRIIQLRKPVDNVLNLLHCFAHIRDQLLTERDAQLLDL